MKNFSSATHYVLSTFWHGPHPMQVQANMHTHTSFHNCMRHESMYVLLKNVLRLSDNNTIYQTWSRYILCECKKMYIKLLFICKLC